MQQISLKLISGSKQYELPFKFKGISDIKTDIYYQLLVNSEHNYFVKSNVSEENFLLFIDYLVHKKIPTITVGNYYDIFRLSDEFDLSELKEIVQSAKKKKMNKYELNLYLLNDPTIEEKCAIEQAVSQDLDDYINNYGTQLMNVNIQSLVNIFNDPNKKFTEHNKAYNLIKQHYNSTKNDSIFILLPKINGNLLNEPNFEDTIQFKSNRFGYMANVNLNYFTFSKKMNELIQIQQKQEKINSQLTSELCEVKNKLFQMNENFNSYKKEKDEAFKLQEKNYNEQLKINKKMNDGFEEIKIQLKKVNDEFNSFKKQTEEIHQKQSETNEKQNMINENQINKNDQIENKLNETNEKIDNGLKLQNTEIDQKLKQDLYKCKKEIEIINKKNSSNITNINQNFTKIKYEFDLIQKVNKINERKIERIESNVKFNAFNYIKGNELFGIIDYLTRITDGNVHDNGTINIISSSNQTSLFMHRHYPRYLCDFKELSSSSMWSPDNEINANLLFDFKTRKVKLTHYTFHTPTNRTSDYPKS